MLNKKIWAGARILVGQKSLGNVGKEGVWGALMNAGCHPNPNQKKKSVAFEFGLSLPFGPRGCSGLGLALVVVNRFGPSALTYSRPQALTLNPHVPVGLPPSVAFGKTGAAHDNIIIF